MAQRRLHAPKLPGLIQALAAAVVLATALAALHHQVGIHPRSNTPLDRLSVNTQVTGLLIASFGGSMVGPAEALEGDIPGMELVETARGRSYRPPLRYLAAIWAGNVILLLLMFYLPIRWWHDRRFRRGVAAAGASAPAG